MNFSIDLSSKNNSIPETNTLTGTIEKIIYQKDNFIIAIIKSGEDEYKIKGNMINPQVKLKYVFSGKVETHTRYGDTFSFSDFKPLYPKELNAIKEYIQENCKWIGPTISELIVNEFKEKTIEICKNNPEIVTDKIKGITLERAKTIQTMLKENETNEELLIKIKEITTGTSLSKRAINQILVLHSGNSIDVIQKNPYSLIDSIEGIGFLTADKLARNVKINISNPLRIQAGITHTLKELSQQGHTAYPETELYFKVSELLKINQSIVTVSDISTQTEEMIKSEQLIKDNNSISLPDIYFQEKEIARMLKELLKHKPEVTENINTEGLKDDQKEAMKTILSSSVSILTGCPGVGKTFLIKKIIENLEDKEIALCSPTGKAAKRMTEMTGEYASTIHILLEPRYNESTHKFSFLRDESFPIDAEVIIIDEVSMVSISLMYHLLKAIKPTSMIILTGDSYQLPAVGPGAILKDLIESKQIPFFELTEIKRQNPGLIITNCHKIKNGQNIDIDNTSTDFFFIENDTPEEIQETILELIEERLPKKYGIDPLRDLQLLSPLREKTDLSCKAFNKKCQALLNPRKILEKTIYKLEDKIINTENDYLKGIVNGDMGFVKNIDMEEKKITVAFSYPDRIVELPLYDNKLELAYCVSCHRYQGSESDIIIMPIHSCLGTFIPNRNWIYTAISRAKKICILVGDILELSEMIRRNRQNKRFTNLQRFLEV